MSVPQVSPGAGPSCGPAPTRLSAGQDWRRIPATTSGLLGSFTARARRIATDLNGFIRSERLDGAEAEILAAMSDLRNLRIHVRQLRAEAKADQRSQRNAA